MCYFSEEKAKADLLGIAEEPEAEVIAFSVKQAAMNLTRKPRSNRQELVLMQEQCRQRTSNLLNAKSSSNKTEMGFSLPQLATKKAHHEQLQQIYSRLSVPKYIEVERKRMLKKHRMGSLPSNPNSCLLPSEPASHNSSAQASTKGFVPRLAIKRRTLFEGLMHNRSISRSEYDF